MRDTTRHRVTDWLIAYPERTRKGYQLDIEQFSRWLDDRDLLDVDRATIQRWLGTLTERGLAAATVRRKASAVWSFFNYCMQEDLLETNPAEYLRRPQGRSAPKRGLPLDQAHALIAAAETHSRASHALVWLMAGAGLRVAEACSARIEDLDGDLLTVTVKGGHRQTKPLSAPALKAVQAAIGDRTTGNILLNRDHQPLTRQRAWELIIRLTTSIGIDHCTPHTLRHTAATLALAAGAPLEDVKELLGHRSLETTLLYIQGRDILGGTRRAADLLGQTLDPGDEEE